MAVNTRFVTSRASRAPAVIALLAVPMIAGILGGCYERVVGARGLGTSHVQVHEPNLVDDRIPIVDDVEDAVFGKRPQPIRKDGVRKPGVRPEVIRP